MAERPILFSAPMVRALLDGTKTQTRRICKPQPLVVEGLDCTRLHFVDRRGIVRLDEAIDAPFPHLRNSLCPYGQPGDRLIVRETWQYAGWTDDGQPCIRYQADGARLWPCDDLGGIPDEWGGRLTDIWAALREPANSSIDNTAADRKWRPSIHMPRWASRLTLEIVSVRVERLRDISEADVIAEGITHDPKGGDGYYRQWSGKPGMWWESPLHAYRDLWESINGPGSWAANPFVWVVEFKAATPAHDAQRRAA